MTDFSYSRLPAKPLYLSHVCRTYVDCVNLDYLATLLSLEKLEAVVHCSMSIRNCRQLRRRQGIVVTILVGKAMSKAIES